MINGIYDDIVRFEQLSKPIAKEIWFSPESYSIFFKCYINDKTKPTQNELAELSSMAVFIDKDAKDIEKNECKIVFSDGSTKILKVF